MLKLIQYGTVLFLLTVLTLWIAGCGTTSESLNNDADASKAANENAAKPSASEKVELTVSAAASLTHALKEIQSAFEAKHPTIKINLNLGASGALQQQIEQGAPADLFLSASNKNMQALLDKQLIDSAMQKNLLTNELVVIVPADSGLTIANEGDLIKPEVKRVAIGIPESVPAGSYAKEALTNVNLWDTLQSKLVQGKDVRQVLNYVETGNADAGFVYKTDALTSQKVKIAFTVDPNVYEPVEYPIGIVKATKHRKESEEFYQYLQSGEALGVFVKYGFSVPEK